MSRIENDKYYTPPFLAKRLIDTTFKVVNEHGIEVTEVVEPSAGNGSFSSQIPGCIAYDIKPESESVIEQDFLSLELSYRRGRVFIGNPPFGHSNVMSRRFFKKCIESGDVVAFIQPISQFNNTLQMWEFDLVHSENLGVVEYSGRSLQCCFNIYIRPKSGKLNPRPDYTLKDITILCHRRIVGDYSTGRNLEITSDFDHAMCNWGNGSFGKVPEFVGQYAQELYFYCHKKEILPRMKHLLSFDVIREYAKSVNMKSMSRMRMYRYLKENIDGIE